jgi:hypothetical protein
MIRILTAILLLLAAPALAQNTSPGLGGSGMTGGRGGYLGPQGAQLSAVDGREHILMLGGAWGVPIKLICEKAEDAVTNVDDEVRCVGRDNKAYAPVFQRPSGNDWVSCNPQDVSGYNSCIGENSYSKPH